LTKMIENFELANKGIGGGVSLDDSFLRRKLSISIILKIVKSQHKLLFEIIGSLSSQLSEGRGLNLFAILWKGSFQGCIQDVFWEEILFRRSLPIMTFLF